MNWRIVHNEQTGLYRIERRRWWGWDFVPDTATGDYMNFNDFESARRWGCRNLVCDHQRSRRWQIVDTCNCPSAPD